ncbi:hypothetical protein GCM10010266_27760 [Streptomyces griseomycini]|uniref:hypothetical protein n=1 Tax=Streptomyces griseomycini TaxID=66895 RepID=UPI0018737720|nr:hypothetical protein [Streptomyces griseomycini]GGQ02804.1 hypothetical protein GCM10010266_27760 [Streptomyces griseomycini]
MNGDWLLRGRDGRLTVYLPSDDAVLCRAELAPGGPWEAPRRIGGPQKLRPGTAVGQGADGYAHLVAWRPTASGESDLVHSTHFRPRLAPLDWTPVGHPDKKGDRTGTPAVAVDDRGRAHVFVRNRGGGVSLLAQKEKGGWNPWWDLGGEDVRDGLAAVTGESGLVELYAAVPDGIAHWRQEEPGGQPVRGERVTVPVRPGTLRALATSAGHTTLFFTDERGELCVWRPGGEPVALLASAGPGPVSAVRCAVEGHDCTVLAQRAADGRAAFAAYPTEQEQAGAWWTESGPRLPADAVVSVALDEHGEVVAAALSPSTGALLLTRRKDEPGLALQAWREI